jgi:hypothetical protein
MNTSESFRALRRANPRTEARFAQTVEAAAAAVRGRIASGAEPRSGTPRLRLVGAAATLAAAAAAAVAIATVGSPGGEVANAAAAFRTAATVTAASAEESGSAVVRITHDGALWGGTTVRWHGDDVSISRDGPGRRGKAGDELRVVDGTVYGIDPADGGWLELGSPGTIDPDSGTTPDEYLAAVREDVGGVTLRRITSAVTGMTTRNLADGSTVYRGTVASGVLARETGFKEGQAIRVLPFGFVAHDEAADAAAPLDTAVTVGPDGVVREIRVAWGTWTYTVSYGDLGSAATIVAPAKARSLLRERMRAVRGG